MRPQDYRRSVGQIRWSEDKRRSIEEQLAKPASGRQRKPVPAWEAERKAYMKEGRKFTRRMLLILAAALLAIGGTAAAVAWNYKKEHSGDNAQNSRIDRQEDPAEFSPQLTDQTDIPYAKSIAQNDNGYYYLADFDWTTQEEMEDLRINQFSYDTERALKYYDANSGHSVFVCAKPNCLHDRNEFCTATTKNYSIISEPVWLDGYVWAIALSNIELLKNPEGCTSFPTVLLRYAPDGTEVTEAAQIYFADTQYLLNADLTAHRGQLWIECDYRHYITAEDGNLHSSSTEMRGGMGLWCYEPKARRLTQLCTSGELKKDYIPNGGSECSFDLRGQGDYVYFHKFKEDWRDPFKGAGIFRIECSTGKIELAAPVKSQHGWLYAVSGDLAYYTLSPKVMGADVIDDESTIRVVNMHTGEDTEFASLYAMAKEQLPWLEKDMIYSTYRSIVSVRIGTMIADGDRLYLSWAADDFRDQNHAEGYFFFTEFDSSGKIIKTIDLSKCKGLEHTEEWIRSYLMKYGYYYEDIIHIAPEDITDFDMEFIRSNGYYETKDGELVDPRKIRKEDIEELEKTGFWRKDYVTLQPEDMTEEDIQRIIRDYPPDSVGSEGINFDGTYFYLKSFAAHYRMTPEECFGEQRIERLFYQ